MMTTPKLKIVELRVRHWISAVDWFKECFNLHPLLMDHAHHYALLGQDYGSEANLAIKESSAEYSGNQITLQWEVTDLSGWIALLCAKGVTVLKPIEEASDEWYKRAVIEGPEGIPLLLFEFITHNTVSNHV